MYVTPGYFDTLQIPVLAGRVFTDADGPDAQPVVDRQPDIRAQIFPWSESRRAISQQEHADRRRRGGHRAVVSLAVECGHGAADEAKRPSTSRPRKSSMANLLSVVHVWFQPSWIVRTAGPVEGLTGQMQRALASADPQSAFFRLLRDE